MNKHKLHRTVLTLLTLLWMLVIFVMSGATDDESKAQSGSVCRILCETFVEDFENLPPDKQLDIEESLSFPVRKCAHFTEYTVLGVLLTLTADAWLPAGQRDTEGSRTDSLSAGFMPARAGFAAPFFTGVLYAVSDEIHQLFVPGRAGQIRDVLIDACGVFVGIIIANRLLRRSAERGQNPDTGAHN